MIKIDNATLYNQDCLNFLKNLEDESVNCVLIDEPYGVLIGHKIEKGYNLDVAKQVRIEAMRVLKKDGWFIFFSQFPVAWNFGKITMEVGFKPWQQCNEIVWCKRTPSSPFGKIARIHENIFVFQKGDPKIYNNTAPFEDITVDNAFHGVASFETIKRTLSFFRSKNFEKLKEKVLKPLDNIRKHKHNDDIYNIRSNTHAFKSYLTENRITSIFSFITENKMYKGNGMKHPTVKPILLLRRLIKLFTQQNDTVLDCFSGSGSTAMACLQEGRNFIGCELDKEYFENSIERLKNWKDDLERQNDWLNERGVMDFESDIKDSIQKEQNLDLF